MRDSKGRFIKGHAKIAGFVVGGRNELRGEQMKILAQHGYKEVNQ